MLLTADCVLLLERIRVFNRAYDLSVCVVLVDGWLLSVFVVTSCAAATAATTAHTPYRHHFDINLVLMCVWRSLPALHWSRMTGHMMPYYMNKLCVFDERWFSWTWMEFIRLAEADSTNLFFFVFLSSRWAIVDGGCTAQIIKNWRESDEIWERKKDGWILVNRRWSFETSDQA